METKSNRAFDYDLIVLGGGSVGIVSGVMAGGLGLRVLLVEKHKMGGECLNTGCIPSKALIHAAGVVHALRADTAEIGLAPLSVSCDEARPILEWVRRTIDTVRDADATEKLLLDSGVTIRLGVARLTDSHTLTLTTDSGTSVVTGEFVLLATGSRPRLPENLPGLSETDYLTNQTVFDLEKIPERLLVLGGGPVGVELAQAFQRLGSQVTLLQRGPRLLPRDDAELVERLTQFLRDEGVDVRLNASLERIDEGRVAVVRQGDLLEDISFDRLLIATGRAANVEDLGLDAAGVKTGEDGVVVDSQFRTSAPNIYACGDVIASGFRFSHVAEYQAKLAVRNIAFPGASRADYAAMPWATFTDPELAHVGRTEEEAMRRGVAYDLYRQSFAQNDRAITDGGGDSLPGLIKVLVEPGLRGKILGVQILGPRAGELLQEWVMAMERGDSIRAIADSVHVYPSLTLVSQHVAQRWYERQSNQPLIRKSLDTYAGFLRPNRKRIVWGVLGASVGILVAEVVRRGKSRRES